MSSHPALDRRPRLALASILIVHVLLGLAMGVFTPIFEAPDEANHFLFVRYLQLHGSLPIQTMDQDGPRAHHPPLYFAIAAALSAWVLDAGPADRVLVPINTTMDFRYGDPSVERKVKFLHSSAEAWPWQGQTLAVHVIRALSVVLSAVAVALTYAIGRLFRPHDPWLAVWSAGLLAFNPMVLFMAGVVQNSTAALAAAAAVTWLLSLWIVRGGHPALAFAAGVALGLGILIQVSTLALAAPVAAVGLTEAWRVWQRDGDLQRAVRHLLARGILVALPAVALTGWWFWRNQMLYGDWSATQVVAALWSDQPIMPAEQTWHLMWTGMIGRFGYGYTLEYSEPIYRAAALACSVGLVLSGAGAWRERAALARSDPDTGQLLAGLHLVVIVVVAAALAYYIIGFIRGGHGRYMFTAYPSLAIVLVAGARSQMGRQDDAPPTPWTGVLARLSDWLGPLLVAGSLALSLHALLGLIQPAYAWPAAPTVAERQIMQPLQATLTDVAEIRGVWMGSARVAPGGTLDVNVVWAPLARTSSPQTVFVHLLHPATGSIAQVDLYPGRGTLATSLWDPGGEFVDRYRLHLPAGAPTGEARLVLGLYDSASGVRVPVTGPAAGSAEEAWVWLGTVFIGR